MSCCYICVWDFENNFFRVMLFETGEIMLSPIGHGVMVCWNFCRAQASCCVHMPLTPTLLSTTVHAWVIWDCVINFGQTSSLSSYWDICLAVSSSRHHRWTPLILVLPLSHAQTLCLNNLKIYFLVESCQMLLAGTVAFAEHMKTLEYSRRLFSSELSLACSAQTWHNMKVCLSGSATLGCLWARER